ncbi:MAG TPA: TonB-dependent receptor [Burkholderiaceae bacterium]|nr:TonB-dependent receptor [Burkholderiaceae bacterium]
MFKLTPMAGALALAVATSPARADTPIAPADALLAQAAPAPAGAASAPVTRLQRVEVKGQRQKLDDARSSLSPETGSTVYRFDKADIDKLPLGEATPLNQVLLRAPGVVADSYGQVHVRGDHANLQYRINGIVIPEAISGFGQVLDTRFADRINVLTGALPAQYGYRTAGVVDIRTQGQPGTGAGGDAAFANNGSIDFVLGSRGHRETSANIGGTAGDLQYFVTGSYLQNQIGVENPTPAKNAVHDDTRQTKGFAYLSYLLGDHSRVALMLGTAQSRFQIPNVPGGSPAFALAGSAPPDSLALDANQRERNNFQVLSFQSTLGDGTDYQIALFNRTSSVHYQPDPVGDLVYNGVAADVTRRNVASGVQLDASRALGANHTLRAGLFAQRERGSVANRSTVFPADDDGNQTSDVPLTMGDDSTLKGHLFGAYLQDEWQPTKALTVNYGLRYDKVDTVTKESQWSPRLGAVYQLGADTRVHAGYARYFTPPPTEKIDTTSVQKFLGTTNALPSDANTAVRSERSNYYDIGVSHQLTPRITLGADAYYRQVQHLQDEGQFGNALIYSAFNFEKGRIFGVELSASYRDERLSGYANIGFTSARGKGIETGQFNFDADELAYISQNWVHLDHEQTLAASAGVSYKLSDATSAGLDALYGSGLRRGFANTEHLPAYVQVNASLSHGFDVAGFGKLDVRLSAINLLDRVYQLRDGSGIGVGAPQYAPRRTLYVALSKPFSF